MRLGGSWVTNQLHAIAAWHRRRPVTYVSFNTRWWTITIVNAVGVGLLVIAKVKLLEQWLWPSLATMLMYAAILALLAFTSLSNGFGNLMGWNKLDFSEAHKKYMRHGEKPDEKRNDSDHWFREPSSSMQQHSEHPRRQQSQLHRGVASAQADDQPAQRKTPTHRHDHICWHACGVRRAGSTDQPSVLA